MNYRRLMYKRKLSVLGISLSIVLFSIETSYKITKWTILKLIDITRWIIRYIQFAKSGYSYSDIYKMIMGMSGREFEIFIAELFKRVGYQVKLTQESNDGGKDIILYSQSLGYTYIETKRWNEKYDVGRVVLQKLVGAAIADNVNNMIFITTSKYNANAYEYARKLNNLQLWDMSDVMKLVTKVDQKYLPMILTKSLGVSSKVVRLNPINS